MSAVPVPQPRARTADSASGAAPDSAGSRRSLAAGLLLGAAGATVVLLASGQTWAEGQAATGGGALPLTADGRDVTGVPAALAIVGLAALVAVFAVRGAGRRIVAALLALSGLGAALSAWWRLRQHGPRRGGGQDHRRRGGHHPRPQPHRLALRHRRRRPADPAGRAPRPALRQPLARHVRKVRARRHPRPGKAPRTAPDPDRPEDLWKALDRGEDPTREA